MKRWIPTALLAAVGLFLSYTPFVVPRANYDAKTVRAVDDGFLILLLSPAIVFLLGTFVARLGSRARVTFILLAIILPAAALFAHLTIAWEGVIFGLSASRIVEPTSTYGATIGYAYLGAILAIILAIRPTLFTGVVTVPKGSTIVKHP